MKRDAMGATDSAETEMEHAVGRLLQVGVVLAGSVMLGGGVLYLLRQGGEVVSYHAFHGGSAEFRTWNSIWRGAMAGNATAIIQLGVLAMIATPVVRVAWAAMSFARLRDWLYTGISLVVLSLLGWALFA